MCHGNSGDNAPSDDVLDKLPSPAKYRVSRPAWGKCPIRSGKATATRNKKIHLTNLETFRTLVYPVIGELLDSESLLNIGKELRLGDAIRRSGFRYLFSASADAGNWIDGDEVADKLHKFKSKFPDLVVTSLEFSLSRLKDF